MYFCLSGIEILTTSASKLEFEKKIEHPYNDVL